MKVSHFPLRVAIGAFFLNSGLSKWNLEGQAVEATHAMAVGAVPQLQRFRAGMFNRLLAASEVAIGTALVVPVVPSALVGLGLCGFGGGLMRLYWATPGMHGPGDPRPTQQGVPLAKDFWLVGAGLTLVLDDLMSGKRRHRGHGSRAGRGAMLGGHRSRAGRGAMLGGHRSHGGSGAMLGGHGSRAARG